MIFRQTSHRSSDKDHYCQTKIELILSCLDDKEVDLWFLRNFAFTKGGFMNGFLRRRVWHKVLDINCSELDSQFDFTHRLGNNTTTAVAQDQDHNIQKTWLSRKNSTSTLQEEDIIARDVGRAVYFRYLLGSHRNHIQADVQTSSSSNVMNDPHPSQLVLEAESTIDSTRFSSSSSSTSSSSLNFNSFSSPTSNEQNKSPSKKKNVNMERQKSTLSSLILSSIHHDTNQMDTDDSSIHYYQGFHDVASVILANFSSKPQLAVVLLRYLAQYNLRDATREDFTTVTASLETLFYPLLQMIDEELHNYLIDRQISPSVFLTWFITLFAHDIHDVECVSRLFDVFIVSHAIFPWYFAMAILIHPVNRRKILETRDDDSVVLYILITELPSRLRHDFVDISQNSDLIICQELIEKSLVLMRKVPPDTLLVIASNYDLGQNDSLFLQAESSILVQGPPKKGVAPYAKADWVYENEKRHRAQLLLSLTSNADVLSRNKKIIQRPTSTVINAKVASGLPMHSRSQYLRRYLSIRNISYFTFRLIWRLSTSIWNLLRKKN